MSLQVKTPPTHTHTSSFDACSSSKSNPTQTHASADSGKKRRPGGHHSSEEPANISKRRRYSASRAGRFSSNPVKSFHGGGSITDPLNLSSLQNRTGPSPAPSPDAFLEKRSAAQPPPRLNNVTDPLNLTIDTTTGEVIGPLSPTGPYRYRRKRLSKKILQKLEIDFDSDNEVEGDSIDIMFRRSAATDHVSSGEPLKCGTDTTASTTVLVRSINSASTSNHKTKLSGGGELPPSILTTRIGSDTHGDGSTSIRTDIGDAELNQKSVTSADTLSPDKHKSKSSDTSHSKPAAMQRQKSTLHKHRSQKHTHKPVQKPPKPSVDKSRPANTSFLHGNYNRYYGYRSMDKMEVDPRIQALKPTWFADKSVLDIGCNIGHVTLTIARDFSPKKVVGVDIDSKLISIARKNVRYYQDEQAYKNFPKSCASTYGPISVPEADTSAGDSTLEQTTIGVSSFPKNVSFMHGNYCLECDALLDMVSPEFDIILALSVTKWIHLNNGDAGLKRCFRRMFLQLRPGGALILEPQMWPSYKKKKCLTETIRKNFDEISLKPDQFNEYLLSEVGFTTCERLNVQEHNSKGFRRPLFIFRKSAR